MDSVLDFNVSLLKEFRYVENGYLVKKSIILVETFHSTTVPKVIKTNYNRRSQVNILTVPLK